MPGDILNHQPAGPNTILPGTWLIDLPPNSAIHVRRYREPTSAEPFPPSHEPKDDVLEKAWRDINTSPAGGVRNVLRDPCAVLCYKEDLEGVKDVKGRELWYFHVKDADDAEDTFEGRLHTLKGLESVKDHLAPVEPAQILNCPRHGHDLSCLLRPSTSQRPLKSCDVRFEPQGEDKVVWERLGQAIVEKLQWNRGKRVIVKREKRLRIHLYPTPTGLQLRTRKSPQKNDSDSRSRTLEKPSSLVLLEPLGLPAIPLGPYPATQSEKGTLGSSFERVLGPAWRDGQTACRTQAQLDHRSFRPYSVYWVPTTGPSTSDENADPAVPSASKDSPTQGVLTIWPTHLVANSDVVRLHTVKPTVPILDTLPEDHLGLMADASSLFDIVSAYREPVPDTTPPGDRSIEESAAVPDLQGVGTPISQPSPAPQAPDSEGEDDLENLFASDTPPRTPEIFESAETFEIFGEPSSRRISNSNNAHLIDYGDVVMSSPPAQEERQASLRQVMGGNDVIEEPEAAFVTEDDFNFFDSPTDDVVPEHAQVPVEPINEPEDQQITANSADHDEVRNESGAATPLLAAEEVIPHDKESEEEVKRTDVLDPLLDSTASEQPRAPAENGVLEDEVAPTHSLATPPSSTSIPDTRSVNSRSLVPSAFEPLDLSDSGTTFAYSLPSPAPTPQHLNADLVERLSSPKTTKKAYEYAAAWLLESPPSEADDDEYTGPPTPISEVNDHDESTATPVPVAPVKAGSGVLEYDGMPCIATEWFAMIGDLDRTQALGRPWVKSWMNSVPESRPTITERKASKKRKRSSEGAKAGTMDLNALATQVIYNRELRRQLIKREISLPHDTDSCVADLVPTGTSLSEFAPLSDEDALEQESSVGGMFKQCDIHLGFRGHVMRMSIASLRYWRELDLQPLGGSKDVKVIALVEGLDRIDAGAQLCTRLGDTYKILGLGEYELDTAFGDGGLLNMSAKDPLAQGLQWIKKQEGNAAILVFSSSATSVGLEAYLNPGVLSDLSPTQVVHFAPLSILAQRDVHDMARAMYDRFPRQLRRVDHINDGEAPWYQYPSFTLSPDDPPKPHLTLQWPLRSFDVFGSWRWIHAAYGWSRDGQSLIVMISDGEGENWGVRVMPIPQSAKGQVKVKAIWDLANAFASSAAIEYRISICHLGIMAPDEIEVWRMIFVMGQTPLSVMMCEPASPFSGLSSPRNGPPNVVPGLLNDPSSTIIDDSLAGCYYTLPQRQPVVLGNSTTFYPESSFFLSLATAALEYDTSTLHLVCHRPVAGKDDEVAESVLARELYRMSCWSRLKFGLEGLPGNLAAVQAVQDVLAVDGE